MTGPHHRAPAAARFPDLPRAACKGRDPALWFPATTGTAASATALAICGRCLERAPCLAYALTERIQWGIWGGVLVGRAG